MNSKPDSSTSTLLMFTLLVLVAVAVVFYIWPPRKPAVGPVFCTLEAKLCPDGSYVGRQGLDCEFAACPEIVATSTPPTEGTKWTYTVDETLGVNYEYPEELSLSYISTVDWPPKLQITDETYSCLAAGSEVETAGRTEPVIINDREYCLTKESEGAAGSVYTQYAYAWPYLGQNGIRQTAIFTFSLRFVQCANYDEPQKSDCEAEQATFGPDTVIDWMTQSLAIQK